MRKITGKYFGAAAVLVLLSCSKKLYTKENKIYKHTTDSLAQVLQRPPVNADTANIPYADTSLLTTNFNLRKPNFVILHHTEQNSCGQTVQTFRLERTKVSAHYVLCKDGTVIHMLNDYLRAWQAGISKWGNILDVNSYSIGIEIDNNGNEAFNPVQLKSLLSLLGYLKKKYNIPTANFIGHADIAPTRKDDPNPYFPWDTLAHRGFGHWYNDTTGLSVPPAFNGLQALRVIGYDIRDSIAAIKSFRLHFEHQSKVPPITGLNEEDRKILFALVPKYY